MTRNARSGIAGAVAATLWAAADPALERMFGTPYSDSKLVGPFITEGRWSRRRVWSPTSLAA